MLWFTMVTHGTCLPDSAEYTESGTFLTISKSHWHVLLEPEPEQMSDGNFGIVYHRVTTVNYCGMSQRIL